MSRNSESLALKLTISLNSVPAFLQIFAMALEFFVFTVFVSSGFVQDAMMQTDALKLKMILVLISLLVFRLLTRAATLIRFVYIPCIAWLCLSETNYESCIVILLLATNMLLDILSKVQHSFYTSNVESESLNSCKVFHYLVLSGCTVLRCSAQLNQMLEKPILNGICIGLMSLMLLLKAASLMKNPYVKELYGRFYFLSIFYFGTNLMGHYLQIDQIYLHLIAVGGSQLLATLFFLKSKEIAIEDYLTKENTGDLTFLLMSYIFSKTYSEANQLAIDKLLNSNNGEQEQLSCIRNITQNTVNSAKMLIDLMDNKSSTELLLKAQLYLFAFGRVVQAKLCIEKAKDKGVSFFQKLCLYRVQQRIKAKIEEQYKMHKQDYFDDFIENEYFRNEIVRGTMNYIIFWEYLESSELIYEKLHSLLEKLTLQREKIEYFFKGKLAVKCLRMTQLYVDFLYLVTRNVKNARIQQEKLIFNEEFELDLDTTSKIYIKFKLEGSEHEDALTIGSVGSNICSILGYSKKQIQGARHTILLPQFYREQHKILAEQLTGSSHIYHYKKETIVRHEQNHYLPCQLNLKLQFLPEHQIQLVGYIRILNKPTYNMANYLFVKESTGEIVQCSTQVYDLKGRHRTKNIKNFFYHQEGGLTDSKDPNMASREESSNFNLNINNTLALPGASQPKQHTFNLQQKQIHMEGDIAYQYMPFCTFPFRALHQNNPKVINQTHNLTLNLNLNIKNTRVDRNQDIKESKQDDRIVMFVCLDPFRDNDQNVEPLEYENAKIERKVFSLYQIDQIVCQGAQKVRNGAVVEYIEGKQELKQKLSNGKPFCLLFVATILMLGVLAIQIYFYFSIMDTASSQSAAMNLTNELLIHETNLIRLEMSSNLAYIKDTYNYDNGLYGLDFVSPSIQLQRTNSKFKSYSINNYLVLNEGGEADHISAYQLVTNVFSQLFSLTYLNVIPIRASSLKYITLDNLGAVIVDSFDEYAQQHKYSVFNSIGYRSTIQLVLFVFICLCSLIVFVLICRVQKSSREEQHAILEAVSGLGKQTVWMEVAKSFLVKVTADEQYYRITKDYADNGGLSLLPVVANNSKSVLEKHIDNSNFVIDNVGGVRQLTQQMSSRENTFRDLIDESQRQNVQDQLPSARDHYSGEVSASELRTSNPGYAKIGTLKNKITNKQTNNSAEVKLKPANKLLLTGTLLSVLIVLGLHGTSWALLNFVTPFNEALSTKNILDFSRKSTLFSANVAAFLSIMSHNKGNTQHQKLFNRTLARYKENEKINFEFPEISLQYFRPFSTKLDQIRFKHVCQGINCSPQYSEDIRIIYATTIQKMVNYMQKILNDSSISGNTFFVNDRSKDYNLRLLVYTQSLLAKVMNSTLDTYMGNFYSYHQNGIKNPIIVSGVTLAVVSVVIIAIFVGCSQVSKLKKRFESMNDIVRQDSFEIKDTQKVDKQLELQNQ